MIRDPSDGSVREKPVVRKSLTTEVPGPEPAITSALPPLPKDAKESARLIKSREWIKNYHSVQSTAEVAAPVVRSPEQGEG
jgi:hypothetical protein